MATHPTPSQTDNSSNPLFEELIVRKMPFEFADDIRPHWNPAKVEWSHMVNGASLAMPYLEPFLMRTLSKAVKQIESDQLRREVKWYMQQEGQHYQQHRKFNDTLIQNGYTELVEIEHLMQETYQQLEKRRSHKFCMAYAAGFESMALAVGHWLINDRKFLFEGSDARVASLILWHFVEEIEHKNVAFDAYQAVYGGYFTRVYAMFYATLHVMKFSRLAYKVMLKKDGLWNKLSSRWKLMKMISLFTRKVLPKMLLSCMPFHHPSHIEDPQWYTDWLNLYQQSDEAVALLDTQRLAAARL